MIKYIQRLSIIFSTYFACAFGCDVRLLAAKRTSSDILKVTVILILDVKISTFAFGAEAQAQLFLKGKA